MSEAQLVTQNYDDALSPEPWAFHLLGLITPLLAISGNVLGVVENQAYVAMGVIFVWGVAPILDIVMGESKVARPPRESGTPFEVLLCCLLYTSPSPRDQRGSRMPSSA